MFRGMFPASVIPYFDLTILLDMNTTTFTRRRRPKRLSAVTLGSPAAERRHRSLQLWEDRRWAPESVGGQVSPLELRRTQDRAQHTVRRTTQ